MNITATAKFVQEILAAMPADDYRDWIFYGAQAFTDFEGSDRINAAWALAEHFAPSGDEARDNRRRANGYIITTSATTVRSTILRRAS